jgi:hypothetical protein
MSRDPGTEDGTLNPGSRILRFAQFRDDSR